MILIVDDIPENLFSLKSVLEHHNFTVDTASSGEEALRKVLKTSYVLILLDVQMPGMDGYEVAELISGHSKTVDSAIMFLSAHYTDSTNILKGYSVGAVDYITKPIDLALLLTRVKTLYEIVEKRIEVKKQEERIKALYDNERKLVSSLSQERKKLLLTQRLTKIASWEFYIESSELVCSNEVYKLLKTDPKIEIKLNTFLEGLTLDEQENFEAICRELTEKQKSFFEYSHHFQHQSGSKLYLKHYGKVELKNGIPYRILGAVQDKTEEKRNEDEFLKLYERYKIVNKATNDIICDWDVARNKLEFNNSITEVLGYPKEVIIQPEDWWENIVHPEDLHQVKRQFETAVFKRSQNWNAECRLRCNDGSYKEVFAQSYCIYSPSGQLVRMVTASKDLSNLREMENQLVQTEHKLLQTVESINEGFFTCNKEWEITYWNNKCKDILQINKEEAVGNNLWDLFPCARETVFYERYANCLSSGRSHSFEEYYEPLDKWFRVNVHPNEEGLAVYFEDISAEILNELELNKAENKLAKIAFSNSHLLRKPLANIMGLLDLLDNDHDSLSQQEIIMLMKQSGEELDEIIKQIAKTTY